MLKRKPSDVGQARERYLMSSFKDCGGRGRLWQGWCLWQKLGHRVLTASGYKLRAKPTMLCGHMTQDMAGFITAIHL